VARDQLTRVASKGSGTLGATFVVGLLISLWSANAAIKSLFDTLNIVYGETEKRGFLKLNAVSLSFTLAGIVFVLAALGAVVIIPVLLNFVGLSNFADLMLRIARWPAMFVAVALALALIYRYGPTPEVLNGAGSPGAAPQPRCSGLRHPRCSPGMPRASASSTKPTAPSAP
jgi:membrane protein